MNLNLQRYTANDLEEIAIATNKNFQQPMTFISYLKPYLKRAGL